MMIFLRVVPLVIVTVICGCERWRPQLQGERADGVSGVEVVSASACRLERDGSWVVPVAIVNPLQDPVVIAVNSHGRVRNLVFLLWKEAGWVPHDFRYFRDEIRAEELVAIGPGERFDAAIDLRDAYVELQGTYTLAIGLEAIPPRLTQRSAHVVLRRQMLVMVE